MSENEAPINSTFDGQKSPVKKGLPDQLTLWVGIVGSLVTITLTIWNGYTKTQIDKADARVKLLDEQLKARTTALEESRERIDRYKWVLTLFPDLNGEDVPRKNFTVGLVRLALTKEEAEQLFTGLQTSSDKGLQSLGQSGVIALQNEPIAILVDQMNAGSAEVRKSAVATLERDYKSSSQAVTLVLRMYDPERIRTLSPSGVINGLYYLSATDSVAWDRQQAKAGAEVVSRVEAQGAGPQTAAAVNAFRSFLQTLPR